MGRITPRWDIRIDKGRTVILKVEELYKWLKTLPDGSYTLTIKQKEKPQRSVQQNRYYWKVCEIISDEIGYTPDEIHALFKSMYLKTHHLLTTKTGNKEVEIVKSTTDLTTTEFENYLSSIKQWASMELGIYIPDPNEVDI